MRHPVSRSSSQICLLVMGISLNVLADDVPSLGAVESGVRAPHIELPYVPRIALPDLSFLDRVGSDIQSRLSNSSFPVNGLEVLGASCVGDELQYQTDSESFFNAVEGAGTYTYGSGDSSV